MASLGVGINILTLKILKLNLQSHLSLEVYKEHVILSYVQLCAQYKKAIKI